MGSEAELSSSLLASGLAAEFPEEQVTSGQLTSEVLGALFTAGNPLEEDNDVWIISPEGDVYFQNADAPPVNLFQMPLGAELEQSVFEEADQNQIAVSWLGKGLPFLMRQQCCVVRPLYQGKAYLVLVHHGSEIQALQRQQFTLLMGIELVLMVVMVVLITNIISDYKRQIIRLATKDELTGLANRKSFNTEFREFMENPAEKTCSLFLLDIDFFKHINDNYGHAAGDNALRFLAGNIQALIDENGGFAGRWGGDEFIGVLPLSGPEANAALEVMVRRIEAAHLPDGFQMTISVGVSDSYGLTDLSKLSEKADLALY
jgi:diguanylate cyclase (GGDEF)-like protein